MYRKGIMNTQGINQTLRGFYKVGVVDPKTNEVEWKQSGSNLIINTGMDNLYNNSVVDQMTYGICGVGTRPNNQFGGTSQISQSGNTVFLDNTSGTIVDFTSSFDFYPHLVEAGDMISCSSGQQLIVTGVPDGFHLTVTPSYTFGDQGFAVYKTSQIGLQTEFSRSNTYLGGAGNCDSTFNGNTVTHRRTYDFGAVVMDKSYNEVGTGWASSGAYNVFSRILINPVIVYAGFILRLVYDLETAYGPTASIYGQASIGGWPVAPSTTTMGTQSVQKFLCSTIATSGVSQNNNAVLDPYYINSGNAATIFASTNSQSLAAFGSSVDRSAACVYSGQMNKAAYVAGTYYCDRTGNTPNGYTLNVRSVGFGVVNSAQAGNQAYCFVFNQSQSLLNTQTLSLTFRHAWSRILG